MKVTKSQLKELIRHTIVDLTEKTFGSKAQYDAYRKKHNLKPGSKHKVDGKTVTVRDTKKMSKKAKSLGDKMADKLNKRMADLEKKRKQGKIKESKKRRFTVKEVRMWMKKLEENRYKKVYNSDARRVAWMVNNEGVELSEMPKSMSKKWTKAQYGRERYLATEFLKSKSEQMNEGKLTEKIKDKKLQKAIDDLEKSINKFGSHPSVKRNMKIVAGLVIPIRTKLAKMEKQLGEGKLTSEQMNESVWSLPKGATTTSVDELDAELSRAGIKSNPDFTKLLVQVSGNKSKINKIMKTHKAKKIFEGLDLKKLETAIKDFQNKIKKQGRVTNARDEDHLKQLIKVYKQMGGKKIKEQMNESKLRGMIREIIRNELNEKSFGDIRKIKFDKKDGKKIVNVITSRKYKLTKPLYKIKGKDIELHIPKKEYNKAVEFFMKNKLNPRG